MTLYTLKSNSIRTVMFPLLIFSLQTQGDTSTSVEEIYVPEDVTNPAWINDRKDTQIESAETINVYHQFTFTDAQSESGIEFLHRIVDDAGKHYKAVHYDHGNGIAVADINGDNFLDIYLVSQAGPNGLFLNLGNGKFKDITDESGTAVEDAIGVSASFADIDNDGDPDLFVTNVRSPNVLFENQGDGKFKDISVTSGLNYNEHSSSATFFDFDNDGLLDVFLTVVGQYSGNNKKIVGGTVENEKPENDSEYYEGFKDAFAGHLNKGRSRLSILYKNYGDNKFKDVSGDLNLLDLGWSGDATPVDFNNDGWQDLYVLNMQGHDKFWLNENGKRFVNVTDLYFDKTPWGAMGVKSFDYNNDGLFDLLISDMHSDMSEKIGVDKEKLKADWIAENWSPKFLRSNGKSIYGNALYQNSTEGFTEVSDQMNVENYWPWGLSVADINADGWQDVLLTSSMNYPFRYAPNTLLLNDQGKRFVDAEYILGIEPRKNNQTSKPWFQVDCAEQDKTLPICRGRNHKVIVHGAKGTRSSVIFDVDNDGDLDIVTNEFGDHPQVFISNLDQTKDVNYLKIHLMGSRSNKDGLGALVKLTMKNSAVYYQKADGKSGYLSQSSMPLYFGLGDQSEIDTIEVLWPSGQKQIISDNIQENTLMVISETAND